jgi:hypothetical protein
MPDQSKMLGMAPQPANLASLSCSAAVAGVPRCSISLSSVMVAMVALARVFSPLGRIAASSVVVKFSPRSNPASSPRRPPPLAPG